MKYQAVKFSSVLSVFLLFLLVVAKGQAVALQHNKQAAVLGHNNLCQNLANTTDINYKVINLALKAHENAKSKGITHSNLMTVIDYSLPSTKKRLWVFDLDKKKVVYHTHVAHGSGSGVNFPRSFSNQPRSHQSSIGLFLTGTTYYGKHGCSLNLHGLEKGINSNAYQRRIVIHSAQYVNDQFIQKQGRLGRSHGCPALSPKMAMPIINTIKNGVLLFAYYPEPYWLGHSAFL